MKKYKKVDLTERLEIEKKAVYNSLYNYLYTLREIELFKELDRFEFKKELDFVRYYKLSARMNKLSKKINGDDKAGDLPF